MYFYEILQTIMNDKDLTIPDVARLSGLTDSTIRSMISRKNKTVALEVAFKLAKGLNVSLNELNGEIPNDTEPIFQENKDPMVNQISELYESLTDDNKKYLYGYMQRLLEEQRNMEKESE